MLEKLMQWVAEKHERRSFLIRSMHGTPAVWVELVEGRFKLALNAPLNDPLAAQLKIDGALTELAEDNSTPQTMRA